MTTSNGSNLQNSSYPNSNYALAWRIFRYLAVRLVVGLFKLSWLLVVRSLQFTLGLLSLIASPASSGRSQDEFKDLVQSDSPDNNLSPATSGDGFWRLYFQAYSPRLWRMRRLLPMSTGRDFKDEDRDRRP